MTIARADSQQEPPIRDAVLVVPVQAVGRNRVAEIERIYTAHHRDVYRYVLGLTRSTDDAEEITAETFERALRAWSAVPARPVAWLLLTARRIATDRWRRARRLARILLTTRASQSDPPSDLETEFAAWFEALAKVLTARQREALLLRYQRDLTDADIGALMGLSEAGVRSLVARALAVLRAHPELLT